MKIIIISGFLGAGKTTFIKEMVQKTGRQFVILENEFGELGIDGELLRKNDNQDTEMKVWELTDGCICCSPNLDFTYSILTIANSLKPDYLIIEPSGVAWPSRIIQQLHKITYEHIQIAPPITIIDGKNYLSSSKQFPDYFYDQLATAGTVVISKSEGFDEADFNAVEKEIKLPPNAEFPTAHYTKWDKETWLSLLERETQISTDKSTGGVYLSFRQPLKEKKQELENFSIQQFNLTNIDTLEHILYWLATNRYGNVTRVKGYCKIAGKHWVKFDLVDSQYAITGCDEMPDERAVIIGTALQKSPITQLFVDHS